MVYNCALDCKAYDDNKQLIPLEFYYSPPCMMEEFSEFMDDFEKEKSNFDSGKACFQPDVQLKAIKDTILVHPTQVCRDSVKEDGYSCHYQLLDEYCHKYFHPAFQLFPSAIMEDNGRKIYLRW